MYIHNYTYTRLYIYIYTRAYLHICIYAIPYIVDCTSRWNSTSVSMSYILSQKVLRCLNHTPNTSLEVTWIDRDQYSINIALTWLIQPLFVTMSQPNTQQCYIFYRLHCLFPTMSPCHYDDMYGCSWGFHVTYDECTLLKDLVLYNGIQQQVYGYQFIYLD